MSRNQQSRRAIKSKFTIKEQHLSWHDFFSETINPTPYLSLELQIRIIGHLDYDSIDKAGEVCRAWRATCSDQHLWYRLHQASFGISTFGLTLEQSVVDWRLALLRAHCLYEPLAVLNKLETSLIIGHLALAMKLVLATPSLLSDEILYMAANHGHLSILEMAITNGANVNHHCEKDGSTPIYIASQNGFLDVVKTLVLNGADYEYRYCDEYTPLYIASQFGRVQVVGHLLSLNANINAKCANGSTPLYIACQYNRLKVVKLLVKSNASVELLHNDFSCMYIAARNGHDKVLGFLLSQFDQMAQVRGGDGSSLVYVAAQNGHAKCVQLLIDTNANIEATFLNGFRPLYIAADQGYDDVVGALCSGGALVNVWNQNCTALYIACQNGHFNSVKLLLNHDANVHMGSHTRTPLCIAAQENHLTICELLLDSGAQVDYVLDLMTTPLYLACLYGRDEIVKLLLRHGALLNGIIGSGKIPLHAAMTNNHISIITMLIRLGADTKGLEDVKCNPPTLEYTQSLITGLEEWDYM